MKTILACLAFCLAGSLHAQSYVAGNNDYDKGRSYGYAEAQGVYLPRIRELKAQQELLRATLAELEKDAALRPKILEAFKKAQAVLDAKLEAERKLALTVMKVNANRTFELGNGSVWRVEKADQWATVKLLPVGTILEPTDAGFMHLKSGISFAATLYQTPPAEE